MAPHSDINIIDIAFSGKEDILKSKDFFEKLVDIINHLISNDFERLVSILYRIDVDEKQLTDLLKKDESNNSGKIIADLIIQRQLQKISTRNDPLPGIHEENNGQD